jgi:hypothetical protein
MRGLFLFGVALLAACRASAPGSTTEPLEGPITEIRKSFTCPLPASRGLITITRDGKAERVIFEGLDFELGKTKSTREAMALSAGDAVELFRLVADSGWQGMPEEPDGFALQGRASCADCCSGALMIKTASGGKSLRFASDRKPAGLEAVTKGIDSVLARGTWTRVVYPWEQQR